VSFPVGGSISVGSRGFYFRAFEPVKQTKRKFTISRNANQKFLKQGRSSLAQQYDSHPFIVEVVC
jgi:hypothetical protein